MRHYQYIQNSQTKDEQLELNEKLLYLANNNQLADYDISLDELYSYYKGMGGLHNLQRSDYSNYWQYGSAKREIENGEFFTPDSLLERVANLLQLTPKTVLGDFTSGIGGIFNFHPNLKNCYSNELSANHCQIQRVLWPELNLSNNDLAFYEPVVYFDAVFGNPPFSLKINGISSEMTYVQKAIKWLKPYGVLALIVPKSFLADEFTYQNTRDNLANELNFLGQFDCTNYFSVGIETKVIFFSRAMGKVYDPNTYSNDSTIAYLIEEAQKLAKENSAKYGRIISDNEVFDYQLRKILYAIESNPKLVEYLPKCQAYIAKYHNQVKPHDMSHNDWDKHKITPKKLLAYCRHWLVKQHDKKPKPRNVIIKQDYGLKIYSDNLAEPQFYNFTDIDYPFDNYTDIQNWQQYRNLWNRKRKAIQLANLSFKVGEQAEYSQDLFELTPIQQYDISRLLVKNSGILQWEQGSGKTIAGTVTLLHRLQNKQAKKVFIVAPAIAIKNNWLQFLPENGIDCVLIDSLTALQKDTQVYLITTYYLNKYKRQIKQMVRQICNKGLLILDESDCIATATSVRSKAVLSAFRRLHYKLLLSGTITRNNIVELWPQMELIYNNSQAFICEPNTIYEVSKEDNQVHHLKNLLVGQPFPPYRKGLNLFKACFNPAKVSVFGVEKTNQDVYNATYLRELLDKTVINRSYEEVTGNHYEIKQHLAYMSASELDLYEQIINEFWAMNYFESTGNPRKDKLLEIIRQLNIMLKACVLPDGEKLMCPTNNKKEYVLKLVNQMSGHIAIGFRSIDSAYSYAQFLRNKTKRNVVVITGESHILSSRRAIIEQIKDKPDTILISTQQALSCAMNIGFIDNIIIPELAWNLASMSQYYFRFIRFNSTGEKTVHFVTYANSIESNLLALLVNKEKLNQFTKESELDLEDFGIEFDLLNMLLSKERDDNKTRINWHKQLVNN